MRSFQLGLIYRSLYFTIFSGRLEEPDGRMKSETPGPRIGRRTEPELQDGAKQGERRGEKEERGRRNERGKKE